MLAEIFTSIFVLECPQPLPARTGTAFLPGCTMQYVAPRGSAKRRTGVKLSVPQSPRTSPLSWVHIYNLEADTAPWPGLEVLRVGKPPRPGGPGLVQ